MGKETLDIRDEEAKAREEAEDAAALELKEPVPVDEEVEVDVPPPVDQSLLIYNTVKAAIDTLLDPKTKAKFTNPKDVGLYLHPLSYYVYMQNTYLDEWPEYEPEVVRQIFAGTEPNLDEILNYHGAWSVLRARGGEITYDIFENIIVAFNDREPSRGWHQDISLEEMCHALTCIQTVMLLNWSDDIKTYIAAKCFHEDFLVVRPEYAFIVGQPSASNFVSTTEIPLTSAYFTEDIVIDEFLGEKKQIFDNFVETIQGE